MLLRGSARHQARVLTAIGSVTALCVVVAVVATLFISSTQDNSDDALAVDIGVPYIVQGVNAGTSVIMHGVPVGEITGVTATADGGALLTAELLRTPTDGLTDTMSIDFRPANYFGVTGVNIRPGAGGSPLRNGTRIDTVPAGNFTLQALLTQLGKLSTGVMTPQLVDVIQRATRYADGITPFIETMITVADTLARVQDTSTAQLLANTTAIAVSTPTALNEMTNLGDAISRADDNFLHEGIGDLSEEVYQKELLPSFDLVSKNLFGQLGKLESAHVDELLPLVNGIKSMTDVIPPIVRPVGFAQSMTELRTRFERMYAGTPEQRALQVRIMLDALPGVAAPLAALGGPQ